MPARARSEFIKDRIWETSLTVYFIEADGIYSKVSFNENWSL